jgi:ketosteroid isomerase-like protein
VSEQALALGKAGLEAWRRGDFTVIEELLDPAVEWRSFESRESDCLGRDEVMDVVRERHHQGFAAGELEFIDGAGDSMIVVAHPSEIGGPDWPEETATVFTFRQGKVTHMQDYRTKDEAVAAAR